MTKHLHKLVDVIKVSDISEQNIVSRELALIKVKSTIQTRSEIMQIASVFRANIVDVAIDSLIVEVSGDEHKINSLHELLKNFGIIEVMRTGTIAINRGLSNNPSRPNNRVDWGEASSV